MRVDLFDFELPPERIALRPARPRDAARMLVVREDGPFEDRGVRELPSLLEPGDAIVFNDTRVIPAALKGVRPARDSNGTDVFVDINLVHQRGEAEWLALARPGKRLKTGDTIEIASGFTATIAEKTPDGELILRFPISGVELDQAIDRHGAMPLPPYIARRRAADVSDRKTYQTSFAGDEAQSVAAPTAGLHFTPRLLSEIEAAGIHREWVRLHVGLGTFAPLKEEQIARGKLHEEWRQVQPAVAGSLNAARAEGHRCVGVGTTALRTLESSAREDGIIESVTGPTDIFIQPGYQFRATDALVTNFHLPQSSLFMLVCALMGTDVMQSAYAHAIARGYRFYSYGDACLLLP